MNTVMPGTPQASIVPPNLKALAVLQTLTTSPYLTVANGLVTFPQAGFSFGFADLQHGTFVVTPYSAGSNQTGTINVNVKGITVGKAYSIQVISGNGSLNSPSNQIIVIAATTSNTDLAAAFNAAFISQFSTYLTTTVASANISTTEVMNSTEGFTFIASDDGIVFTQSVANTLAAGSVAQVNAWGGTQVTTGQFVQYTYTPLNTDNPQFDNLNANNHDNYVIFVDQTAANFSSVDTSLRSLSGNMSYLGSTYCQFIIGDLLSPQA
jgi:hypothetical protein